MNALAPASLVTAKPVRIGREQEVSPPVIVHISDHSHKSPSRIPRLSSTSMKPTNRLSKPKYPSTVSNESTRDSSYSGLSDVAAGDERLSVIVSTANAISLQRAAVHTKSVGEVPILSPRAASVEKSIGVTTRSRRSREGSARSYSRSETERDSHSISSSKVTHSGSGTASSKVTTNLSALKAATAIAMPFSLDMSASTSKSKEQTTNDSAMLSTSTSPAQRFLSPITSAFSQGQAQKSTNSMDALDPYSDTWGQNSAVAAERAAMGDLSEVSDDTSHSFRRPRQFSCASTTSSMASRSVLSSRTTAREVGMTSSPSASLKAPSERLVGAHQSNQKMLEQLLASLALIDSRPYKSLQSIEEVEWYKKELARVEKRNIDVQHKLKVEMRVRDAADKLRKTGQRRLQHVGLPGDPRSMSDQEAGVLQHSRIASIASAVSQIDAAQAEAGVAEATKRTDAISRELIASKEEAMTLQRKLLEHQTRTLALRVSTLEAEQAERLQAIEEEEKSKVGANLAIEEVDKIRDKLSRVERSLDHERRDREEEVARWKRKLETESTQSKRRQADDEKKMEEKWKQRLQEAQRQHEAALKQVHNEHAATLSIETTKRVEVEGQLAEQNLVVSQLKKRQSELEQLELEMTAERNIMTTRQQLFVAFEKRLNRAEKRLREQDERCAQMLGKVDGRDEMDDMLERIKAGYGAIKKEKTAGQDIDGLIDSIATHIGDLEDELHRAGKWHDNPAHRSALETQLETAERELEVWKSEAETARKNLTAVQRQSLSSVRSRNILSATATETEARMALMEKKNAALEAEMAQARLHSGVYDQSSSPSAKVAGAGDARDMELLHNAIQALLCMLPALDPMNTDLRKLQWDLSQGSHQALAQTTANDAEENCHEVMDRSRALITVSTRLVDRTLASESKQEAFESELMVMEQQCEDLRSALEDLRRGNASHKVREKNLQTTVNELRKSLTAKSVSDMNVIHLDKLSHSFSSSDNLSRPSQSTSSSSIVSLASTPASRRFKGIAKPLPMARSNSNLSFTSCPRINGSPMAQSSSMPQNVVTHSKTTALPATKNAPPRSMTLGMGAEELRLRVRQLENELILAKAKGPTQALTPPMHAIELQQELQRELDEHRRELDYVKGVESKQRIDLLDELTTLTEELSQARAQLRAEQRKKAKRQGEEDDKTIPTTTSS